ncbi:pre-mRNA 3' end processing protein WDR33-like [Ptychodera flava]|uniref:pre-mRNA 3' end processing protein WDR33-like n=1 Tax=Ptychodera flava TaxID=63121 RepID=UPI003969EB76
MDGGVATQPPPQRFFHMPRLPQHQKQNFYRHHGHAQAQPGMAFDGKRMRKAVHRRTIDYNASCIRYLENRLWQRDYRDMRAIQPDNSYGTDLPLPTAMTYNTINSVTTKFVRTSTNKVRCPIFVVRWTPEGRRLVTGASSGEFTLWNGLTFNFETILQAHEYPVRTMTWSHNDMWMLTGDHAGYVKYWQSNMNNVKMFQAHKEPIREASFCPTDNKFATCSDDGTVRIWDFLRCHEERILRGHGADVRCVDWHPIKSLLVSGSKDSQQPVKLWDPKMGTSLATLHAHKNTVMGVKWNQNGNWLLTASRDHLIKLFDIRMMKEMFTFRGHKKEATTIAWHPIHENLFSSGGSDGAILFWQVGNDKEVGGMEQAHEGMVWSLAWHPLGHILCSGSNDHSTKFWTRNRPGDKMRDKYNLNLLPAGSSEEALEYDDESVNTPLIPGMGLEHGLPEHLRVNEDEMNNIMEAAIPGLGIGGDPSRQYQQIKQKKVPYAKPIPAQFKKQWERQKDAPLLEREKEMEREREQKDTNQSEDQSNAPMPLMATPIIPTFEQGKQIAMQMLLSGAAPLPQTQHQGPPQAQPQGPPQGTSQGPPQGPPQGMGMPPPQVQAHSAMYASVQAQIQESMARMPGPGQPGQQNPPGGPPPGMGQQRMRNPNMGPGILGEPPPAGGYVQGMRPPMPGMMMPDHHMQEEDEPPPPPPPPPKDSSDRRDPRHYQDKDMRQPPGMERSDPRLSHDPRQQRHGQNDYGNDADFGPRDVDLRQNIGYDNMPPQDEDLRDSRFEPHEHWAPAPRDLDERRSYPGDMFYGEEGNSFGQKYPQDFDEREDFSGGRQPRNPGGESLMPNPDDRGRGYPGRQGRGGHMPSPRDQDERRGPPQDFYNDYDERSHGQPDMRQTDSGNKPPSLLDLPRLPPPPHQKRPWEEGPGSEGHGNHGDPRLRNREGMSLPPPPQRGAKHGRYEDEDGHPDFPNPSARVFVPGGRSDMGRDPRARGGGGGRGGPSDRSRGRGGMMRGGRGMRGMGPPSRGPGRGGRGGR